MLSPWGCLRRSGPASPARGPQEERLPVAGPEATSSRLSNFRTQTQGSRSYVAAPLGYRRERRCRFSRSCPSFDIGRSMFGVRIFSPQLPHFALFVTFHAFILPS